MGSGTIVLVSSLVAIMWFMGVIMVMQMKVKRIAESTHVIVNSQRTMLLRLIAQLTGRIAEENPTDAQAQNDARIASQDAEDSELPRREQSRRVAI